MELNLNSIQVDDSGRVSFSGLSSGIDFQGVVDSMIAARSIRVDLLQTQVDQNTRKIAALGDLKTNLTNLKASLSQLHGAVTFGDSQNIFEAKQAFATSSRTDGGTASQAGNLVGVSVTNSADAGNHTVEILKTAKAHKVSSDLVANSASALGFADNDSFDLNGQTIVVNSGTTLLDLRDIINNANSGSNAIGITASIVDVSANEHYLLLTSDDTGQTMTIADTSGTPLETIGILESGGAIKNELQAAQTAQFYADGVLDQTNTIYESDFQSASTVQIGSDGTIQFTEDGGGSGIGSVSYSSTDTLTDIATDITANVTGVTASVVNDGAGVRLEISGTSAFSMAETGGGSALTDLGIDNKRRVIERDSNTVSDLFNGITLNLFQAEKGTTISIDVEQDLSQVKSQIVSFIDTYNELRIFVNDQRELIEGETQDEDNLTGVLFSSSAVRQIDQTLSQIISSFVPGLSEEFNVLTQSPIQGKVTTGINFIARDDITDPLLEGTIVIDETKLDEALLNNADEIRKLFTFDFSASDPRITLLGFDRNTTYNASGYTLNLYPGPVQSINQFAWTEEADNGYWTTTRGSIAADVIAAPGGATTADGLVASTDDDTHFLANTSPINVTAGETYLFSTYAKAGDSDEARLSLKLPGLGDTASADFDLTTGTVVSGGTGADDVSIEDAGNGWYRISVKATAVQSGGATFERYASRGGDATFKGDGTTVETYFWGAQLEDAAADSTLLQESDFAPSNASISSDVEVDPDGTNTADGLNADSLDDFHFVSNTTPFSVTSGESYEFVTYAKKGDVKRARLEFTGANFAAGSYADFKVDNGDIDIVGPGAASTSVVDVGNGWYRIGVTATATGTGTANVNLYSKDDGNIQYSGDPGKDDIYFWDSKVVHDSGPAAYSSIGDPAPNGPNPTANIDGLADASDDGSVSIDGNVITVETGGAKGLKLFFDGFNGTTSLDLDFTVGIGAQLFFELDKLLDETTGSVETEIDNLTDQNEFSEERIEEMRVRLEIERQDLLERFLRMETALATANRILDSIKQTTDAMFANNN